MDTYYIIRENTDASKIISLQSKIRNISNYNYSFYIGNNHNKKTDIDKIKDAKCIILTIANLNDFEISRNHLDSHTNDLIDSAESLGKKIYLAYQSKSTGTIQIYETDITDTVIYGIAGSFNVFKHAESVDEKQYNRAFKSENPYTDLINTNPCVGIPIESHESATPEMIKLVMHCINEITFNEELLLIN